MIRDYNITQKKTLNFFLPAVNGVVYQKVLPYIIDLEKYCT